MASLRRRLIAVVFSALICSLSIVAAQISTVIYYVFLRKYVRAAQQPHPVWARKERSFYDLLRHARIGVTAALVLALAISGGCRERIRICISDCDRDGQQRSKAEVVAKYFAGAILTSTEGAMLERIAAEGKVLNWSGVPQQIRSDAAVNGLSALAFGRDFEHRRVVRARSANPEVITWK
jgi:hypothetical protein